MFNGESEHELNYTSLEWLLNVIGMTTEESAGRLLLLLWHTRLVRNDATHSAKAISVVGSAKFRPIGAQYAQSDKERGPFKGRKSCLLNQLY